MLGAAGAGITAGLVAGARPAQAAADQGTPVLLGQTNDATATTIISSSSSSSDGFYAGISASGSSGVVGADSTAGGATGVFAPPGRAPASPA